jgi:hypothetical protein
LSDAQASSGVAARRHGRIVRSILNEDVELACQVSRGHQAWFVDMLNAGAADQDVRARVI